MKIHSPITMLIALAAASATMSDPEQAERDRIQALKTERKRNELLRERDEAHTKLQEVKARKRAKKESTP